MEYSTSIPGYLLNRKLLFREYGTLIGGGGNAVAFVALYDASEQSLRFAQSS